MFGSIPKDQTVREQEESEGYEGRVEARLWPPPPPSRLPGPPAPTDIQVAAREGGSNHQQMGLRSAGLVQDAARLKGRRCHRHGDGWPPVLMLITAKHTAQLQRQHGRDSGRSHRQDVSGAENKSIFDP